MFALDKERDIIVELYRGEQRMAYVLRTPNHHTGNLIRNLAALCGLPLTQGEDGLQIIRGTVPCYVDGENRTLYIFRLGNTKVANIFPDGRVEMKASIPAISKTLMSQTKDYRLSIAKTIVKTYLFADCKFRTDLHTHMSGNLDADVLIALGIRHQIRYPLYYIKKLGLKCTPRQWEKLRAARREAEAACADSGLAGKYLDRKIDDHTFLNFADLMLNDPEDAPGNIAKIRNSLAVPKDGQAVFADLEKVYLYRYVFTRGVESGEKIRPHDENLPDGRILALLRQMRRDAENPDYRDNTLFQNKLLLIARNYRRCGVQYAEISDTALLRADQAAARLAEIHRVMPHITRETGVVLRFLAAIRRTPLTIVRDQLTPNDYLAENIRVLRAIAADPYVAGSDIVGEETNDIGELQSVIAQIVRVAEEVPGFVIRIHAGENDGLRDNVAESIRCVRESLMPGQAMPRLRIGHGLYTSDLSSPRGKKLIADLKQAEAVLEFQITSNVRLNNLSDLARHPLRRYLRAGIRCVQGTDGGAIYGTDSIDEELALEKMLDLTHEELCLMRRAEDQVLRESLETFENKKAAFDRLRGTRTAEEFLAGRIRESAAVDSVLWQEKDTLRAEDALRDLVRPLPEGKTPVIIAGGSFNSDRHAARVRESDRALIDGLLSRADPDRVFFMIGHSLRAVEGYLAKQNKGRFAVFAMVPERITRAEAVRLRRAGVSVRVSIEASGNGLYKSFAYEVFKRRPSCMLVFDGNSPAANLMQEGKNGRFRSRMYLSAHSRTLRAKARALEGYVTLFGEKEDAARVLRGIEEP